MRTVDTRLAVVTILAVLGLSVMGCFPGFDFLGVGAGQQKAVVERVDVDAVGGASPRYVARATGLFPDTCTRMGRTTQKVVRSTIYVELFTRQIEGTGCVPESVPFEERIRLDVGGLSPGSYAVDVNGTVASFTLAAGN